MSHKPRDERLLILRRLEAQIKNGSMTDEEKESIISSLKEISFWRDESKAISRKAGRAPRGKRPYK